MRKFVCCCLAILLLCCKEKYDAPVNVPKTGYLVIEGYISANGPAELHLSRSIPLADSARLINETSASVKLQGRDNSTYNITESGGGTYTNTLLNLNNSVQYRLYIKTRDGKEYASDFVNVRTAPLIDSVGWLREDGGLQIYVNTHDPKNNTWYYRWTTEETWEYHSTYYTRIEYWKDPVTTDIIGVKWRKPNMTVDETLFTCWQGENSTNLILGSSAKLSIDSIHRPLISIPQASWKLSVLYSLLVKQYALTREEYEFLDKMKKNSEETGNVFGRQPSELKGNIRCLSNPSEPVIGYIGIANRQEKRIWISRPEVSPWGYYQSCETHNITKDSAEWYSNFFTPVIPLDIDQSGTIQLFLGASHNCVDCTLRGTNKKPSFWP
jgi:hypothetical protein